MKVASREELLACLAKTNELSELYAIGMTLMSIAIAKQGETLQDSIDIGRHHVETSWRLEDTFRASWDNMRNWK